MNDIELNIFTPVESILKMSLNEFQLGDTIVGEISLSYKDCYENSCVKFCCDGHFVGVINQGSKEWEKITLHRPSGEYFFSTNNSSLDIVK